MVLSHERVAEIWDRAELALSIEVLLAGKRVLSKEPLGTRHVDLRVREQTVTATVIRVQVRVNYEIHFFGFPAQVVESVQQGLTWQLQRLASDVARVPLWIRDAGVYQNPMA